MRTTTYRQHRTVQRDETSLRNAANRQEGADFEKRLNGYHEELRLTGKALIYKTNPDIRMTGPGRAAIVGRGPCDYFGFLSNGRVVMFDAKSRAQKAFSIGDDMQHQITWMLGIAAQGHTAGLLVYWKDHGQVCWHPVQSFDKRVRMEDGTPCAGVDWLETV